MLWDGNMGNETISNKGGSTSNKGMVLDTERNYPSNVRIKRYSFIN